MLLYEYLIAGLLGAAVGLAELLSRYKDQPWRAVSTPPAISYIFINALSSVVALDLCLIFKVDLGRDPSNPLASEVKLVLLAGFGSMSFFRSSLFTVRVGGHDVGIGPSTVLQSILDATDREVDRRIAIYRDKIVKQVTASITFEKAKVALPAYCIGLMQNLTDAEQAELGKDLDLIGTKNMSDDDKARLLVLALVNCVGPDVVRQAVKVTNT